MSLDSIGCMAMAPSCAPPFDNIADIQLLPYRLLLPDGANDALVVPMPAEWADVGMERPLLANAADAAVCWSCCCC